MGNNFFQLRDKIIFSLILRKGMVSYMKEGEYSVKEMKALLDSLSGERGLPEE